MGGLPIHRGPNTVTPADTFRTYYLDPDTPTLGSDTRGLRTTWSCEAPAPDQFDSNVHATWFHLLFNLGASQWDIVRTGIVLNILAVVTAIP
ncbi:uncharacterized protein YALI1_B00101g [Yarrowia lipolytica]|uniref:Uncharacterized protein n=1 Tax=Yarrowia lipolytica TaxID=4952 RepID=A0A1D8N5R7_YARLL|nr:hypothetical protein YALI1_B00101g [Yarrowia lipolytica]